MEANKIANRKIPRGARKVTLWDTRTLSETTVFYGYQTPEEKPKKVVKGVIEGKISIHKINETQKGINALFKADIPEINSLTLYPKYPESFKVEIGDCEKQRRQYPYRIYAKNRIRRIKKRESPPLTLNNLKFSPKFVYTVSFKCSLCDNHQTMRVKNHKLKRKTPICKKHKQSMFIAKVTKKRPKNTDHVSIPKIIYEA